MPRLIFVLAVITLSTPAHGAEQAGDKSKGAQMCLHMDAPEIRATHASASLVHDECAKPSSLRHRISALRVAGAAKNNHAVDHSANCLAPLAGVSMARWSANRK